MTPVDWGLVIVGLIVAALLARGMYLIGSRSNAELEARSLSTGNNVLSTGWVILDGLRTTSHPAIRFIESKLGMEDDTDELVVKHTRCGSTNVVKRGSGWYCYDCEQQTTAIEECEK